MLTTPRCCRARHRHRHRRRPPPTTTSCRPRGAELLAKSREDSSSSSSRNWWRTSLSTDRLHVTHMVGIVREPVWAPSRRSCSPTCFTKFAIAVHDVTSAAAADAAEPAAPAAASRATSSSSSAAAAVAAPAAAAAAIARGGLNGTCTTTAGDGEAAVAADNFEEEGRLLAREFDLAVVLDVAEGAPRPGGNSPVPAH